jgi:branched-chain amino acid aminotransferase
MARLSAEVDFSASAGVARSGAASGASRDTVPRVSESAVEKAPEASPDRRIWLDGELVPWARATVHVLSHSLQRGSLIFDFLSVHRTPRGPAIFRLREHVERLLRSAELVGLPLRMGADEIGEAIVQTVRANPGSTHVKVSAYIGSVEVDVVPADDRVSLAVAAYDPGADIAAHKPGGQQPAKPTLRLWIEKTRRNRRRDIIAPQAKVSANYVSPMAAKWEARRRGYDDVLLVDEDGYIAEGPTTNVFFFDAAGALRTPPDRNVLLGVTRSTAMEIAKHEGTDVREDPVTCEDLIRAREVFVTGTTAGICPVVEIDRQPIGGGAPGPKTLALRERFETITRGGDAAFDHWLTYLEGA